MELKKDFVFHLCSSKRNQPPADSCKWLIFCCRGDWIRTSDHTPPPDVPQNKQIAIIQQFTKANTLRFTRWFTQLQKP